MLLIQRRLGSRYELVRPLSPGGMSTVYLAVDHRRNIRVAVKVMRQSRARTLDRRRFEHEVEVLGRMNHECIPPLLDGGEAHGIRFLVTPYVPGRSLRERIRQGPPMDVPSMLGIVSDLGGGLSHVHGLGVIHRDVKPGNVMLSDGGARLLDFGISLTLPAKPCEVGSRGLVTGTPEYMSPEQACGSVEIDARTDVYSLGCVAFEMLAGKPPFTGRSARTIATRKLWGEVPPIRSLRSDVPAHVDRALRLALAPLPDDRLESVSALLAAMEDEAGEPRSAER